MKKLLCFIFACVLSLSAITFVGCKGDDDTKIRVNEVTHSIFYAPFYVAIEKGYFKDEGLEIELTNGGGSDASMTALLSGAAEVILAGPETAVYTAIGKPKDCPVIFAQLTKRDGSLLMGRVKEENFEWKNLNGKEIIAGRRGGSPAMSLEYALNKNELFNGKNVTLNFDVQFSLTAAAFEGGTGDYVTMFEPTASEYVRAGKAHIIASVGQESGEVPFTCFMTKRDYYDKKNKNIEKFTRALYKAIKYIKTESTETVAEFLKKQFPSASDISVKDSLETYKRIDAWTENMSMKKDAYNRLLDVMTNAGELKERVEYDTLVDTLVSNKLYAEIF